MKEILYLDTDLIHSFLSQINEGLPGETANEREQSVADASEKSKNKSSLFGSNASVDSGKISVPFLLDTPSGKVEVKLDLTKGWSETTSLTQTETGRELITKKLHDDALFQLIKHLKEKDLIKNFEEANENEYIEFQTSFQFFDTDYLHGLMNPDLLSKVSFFDLYSNLENIKIQKDFQLKSIANSAQRKIEEKKINDTIQEGEVQLALTTAKFTGIQEMITYLQSFLPTSTFAKLENSFTYLKPAFLREDPKVLMFKYPALSSDLKVTIIGKKTRKISVPQETPDYSNLYSIPMILDTLLIEIGLVSSNDTLVSPIAIYFE
ncbi:hypothetical protein [Planomicrobium sp. CPCC 101079]|uniref:DUF6414 family protein n=1 Tax=Planomicrobium sp. CPCC 101079 TaxID=2599618 RepID=UPI0011B3F672|nr:hypothetical protein [Planomicrobium sp. CPCC 101079]TWT04639.1 hypothetical protein FQV28_08540 [Planomicrobium sp. CPCC 101079]